MEASNYFSADHFFVLEDILRLESLRDGEPRMSGKIILQREYIDLFTLHKVSQKKKRLGIQPNLKKS
jgi:hypothetical protein